VRHDPCGHAGALACAGTTRIELNGLSTQDIQTLASAVLKQEVSRCTAEGLRARTEGNPFFLRELIKLLPGQPHTAPVEAVLDALDTAAAAGLVMEDQQRLGWFRFIHPVAAEVLYETIGRLRRAHLHRRIGAAAARLWTGIAERAAEIARHWLLAAELDPTAAA
jgi:predicted ATPase